MQLFLFDRLAVLMILLVSFVAVVIGAFASRYLMGDRKRGNFFIHLLLFAFSMIGLAAADNLLLFFILWGLSNALLVRMMIHKSA